MAMRNAEKVGINKFCVMYPTKTPQGRDRGNNDPIIVGFNMKNESWVNKICGGIISAINKTEYINALENEYSMHEIFHWEDTPNKKS
jgi:hypothetical protein